MIDPVLRPVPVTDPRPHLYDKTVLDRALSFHTESIAAWAKGRALPSAVGTYLPEALRAADGDAFKAARFFEQVDALEADMAFCRLLDNVIITLPHHLRLETQEWVMRTGMRFPAYEGDIIEWFINGETATGEVIAIDKTQAQARVRRHTTDDHPRVYAEVVGANITQKLFARRFGDETGPEDAS